MNTNALSTRFAEGLTFAAAQARRLISSHPDYLPMYTVGGKWNREGDRWTHWCEGFFPGILWLLHRHTGDTWWRSQAERYTRPLEPRKLDRNVHDLGFIFMSTYLRWYELTGDRDLRDVLIQAGRTLAQRYQPKGKYLASFLGPQSLFIDIMMNVGIIFWAARETGDEALRQIALDHCHTTARYLVRADGGTAHEGLFDTASGAFLRQSTQQGVSAESTWTRGLAWALYGFTTSFQLSGEREFLETAERCAACFMRRAGESGVPLWDFDVPPDGPRLWDSSAGAIAAAGLLQLHKATGKQAYRDQALVTLATLCGPEFLASQDADWEGILKHGVYHLHKNLGVDESVIWGDHFFVEALVDTTATRLAD